MSEASLSAQRQAVISMRAHGPLVALVPALNIFDRHQRPEVFPCIIVGEGQTIGDDIDVADSSDVYLDLHVWTKEDGFIACKDIAGEIRRALRRLVAKQGPFDLSFNYQDTTFLRDPSREHSHGIVSFMILASEYFGT